jgi:hypothetical protein
VCLKSHLLLIECLVIECLVIEANQTSTGVQVVCGHAFAVMLNRLSANMMPDAWKPEQWRDMEGTVQLTADSPRMTTPGELIAAIKNNLGATVEMQIVTRITSFGKGVYVSPVLLAG